MAGYSAEKGILIDSLTLKTNDNDFRSKSQVGRHHAQKDPTVWKGDRE